MLGFTKCCGMLSWNRHFDSSLVLQSDTKSNMLIFLPKVLCSKQFLDVLVLRLLIHMLYVSTHHLKFVTNLFTWMHAWACFTIFICKHFIRCNCLSQLFKCRFMIDLTIYPLLLRWKEPSPSAHYLMDF